MNPGRRKILFFAPHGGLWVHSLAESYLAKCLDPREFDVSRIACDGAFGSHCTVMEGLGISLTASPAQKAATCTLCRANTRILRSSFAGSDHRIEEGLEPGDIAKVDAMMAGLKGEALRSLAHQGVEVGRIAAYEILLKFKKSSFVFEGVEEDYHFAYTRNALLSLIAFIRLYGKIQPDILVTYSPQYGVCGAAARYCEMQGKRVYFLEGSSNIEERYRATRVWDWEAFGLTNPALKYWDRLAGFDMGPSDRERADRHTKRLLEAKSFSVYSVAATNSFDLRGHFGFPAGAKVLMAAMSSYDEAFAAYVIGRFPPEKYLSQVFKDQLEWIRETVDFFRTRADLYLVIRIHPRTFPSARNAVMAADQVELTKILTELPPNVKANYPSDKISIYDLYPQIDVLVTGWSATAVEAMLYRVPVVTYDRNLPSYPAGIHYTGASLEEYLANLGRAAAAGKTPDIEESARNWMAFSMSVGVVRHPAPLSESGWWDKHEALRLAFRATQKLFPGLIKRVDAARRIGAPEEAARFNALLRQGGRSLYDIPRGR